MTIVQDIVQYPRELEKLEKSLAEHMAQSDVVLDPYLVRIYGVLSSDTELQRLIKNTNIDQILQYHSNEDYTILNTGLTTNHINMLVALIRGSGKHLICYLEEYKKLLTDPNGYYQELHDSEISRITYLITNLKTTHQRNLETIRQILDINPTRDYKPYDFSFIVENYDRKMIVDHWNVVMELGLETAFYNYRGLYECDSDSLSRFSSHEVVKSYGHSGCSMSYICQRMHEIAAEPWTSIVHGYISKYMSTIKELRSHFETEQEFVKAIEMS